MRHFSFISRLAIITSATLVCLPTGNGLAGAYRNSAHGGSNDVPTTGQGAKRSSIPNAAGNCAHCHEEHATLGGAGPADHLLFDTLTGNAVCNTCHNGSIAPPVDNIASQIAKTYSHDPNYGTGAALCHDCHDSHVAQHTNHVEATDGNSIAAGSPLLAVKGTSATDWFAGNPGAGLEQLGSFTATPNITITREYQLCFKCHAGQLSPGAPDLDVALQFNPNNYSVHPVATENNLTWKNTFLQGAGFPAAWNGNWAGALNAEMYCSDCHGSETTADPKGPHGSTINYMLKAGNTPAGNYDLLCLKCHNDPAILGNSGWYDLAAWNWWPPANPSGGQIAPAGPHNLAQHKPPANPAGCVACHGGTVGTALLASNIHGANYLWPNYLGFNGRTSTEFLLPSAAGANITQNYYNNLAAPFTNTPGNRRCVAACHTVNPAIGYLY